MSRTYTSNPSILSLSKGKMRSKIISACLIGASFYMDFFLFMLLFSCISYAFISYQVWQRPLALSAPRKKRQKQAMTKTSRLVFPIDTSHNSILILFSSPRQNASLPLKSKSPSSSRPLCSTSSWPPTSHRSFFQLEQVFCCSQLLPPRTR